MIIPGKLGFNCPSGFREEAFWNIFPIGSNIKLSSAVAAILNFKMTTTAGHSFYIGPIGSFYNQVNDTDSWEPLVHVFLHFELISFYHGHDFYMRISLCFPLYCGNLGWSSNQSDIFKNVLF
jgi:hypothetical protein